MILESRLKEIKERAEQATMEPSKRKDLLMLLEMVEYYRLSSKKYFSTKEAHDAFHRSMHSIMNQIMEKYK